MPNHEKLHKLLELCTQLYEKSGTTFLFEYKSDSDVVRISFEAYTKVLERYSIEVDMRDDEAIDTAVETLLDKLYKGENCEL